ncbi:MAG: acylphosphatase, partial [bacterium]|nr:acylphosphatase [bacterium]
RYRFKRAFITFMALITFMPPGIDSYHIRCKVEMSLKTLPMIVSGRVQGVGFRYFTLEEARAFELTGYVKNLTDGNVEIYAEGPEQRLKSFYKEMKQGPSLSRVLHVEEDWQDLNVRKYREFRITY